MRALKFILLGFAALFFISACVMMRQETSPSKVSPPSASKPKPSAQKEPSKKEQPSISKVSQNSMSDFLDSKQRELLRQKLKAQKDLKIRIFGDSHMAADFFSRQLRKVFIKANSVGFIYPLQPKYQQTLIMDYESKDFEILNSKSDAFSNYPMGGIIARSKAVDAFIKLHLNLKVKNLKFALLFQSPNSNGAFLLKDAKNRAYTLKSEAGKWSFKEFKNLTFPLQITALQKDALLGGYFISKDKNNVFIDTLGVNGARSDLWMKWNLKVFEKELDVLKNDLIILAYGSNDALGGAFDKAKFKNNYKKLIALLRKHNKNAAILLISPPTITQKKGDEYVLSEYFYPVQAAILELAKEEKTLLFDMHNFMQNSGGKDEWVKNELSLQDVHLSISGYELMADKFYKDLRQTLNF